MDGQPVHTDYTVYFSLRVTQVSSYEVHAIQRHGARENQDTTSSVHDG